MEQRRTFLIIGLGKTDHMLYLIGLKLPDGVAIVDTSLTEAYAEEVRRREQDSQSMMARLVEQIIKDAERQLEMDATPYAHAVRRLACPPPPYCSHAKIQSIFPLCIIFVRYAHRIRPPPPEAVFLFTLA